MSIVACPFSSRVLVVSRTENVSDREGSNNTHHFDGALEITETFSDFNNINFSFLLHLSSTEIGQEIPKFGTG